MGDIDRFKHAVKHIVFSHCVVYVKVVYTPNLVRMLGKQLVFSTYNLNGVNYLQYYIGEQLLLQLEEYCFTKERINHLIITIIPIKLNLLTKYKRD